MSGQLVGEVIAAWPTLQKRGLSERGFHALIGIAEKCNTQTRRGSVRWDHIRNCLCGASKRTAQRAVQDLQTTGVVRVVKVGFNNNNGRVCAPIYEIEPLTDNDTWVSQSHETDDDSHVSRFGWVVADTSERVSDTAFKIKTKDRVPTMSNLGLSTNGLIDHINDLQHVNSLVGAFGAACRRRQRGDGRVSDVLEAVPASPSGGTVVRKKGSP